MELNKEIEVSKIKYNILKKMFKGIIAHRVEGGKYYVKALLFLGYKKMMETVINS